MTLGNIISSFFVDVLIFVVVAIVVIGSLVSWSEKRTGGYRGGGSYGGAHSSGSSYGHIPSSATGKVYSKEGKGFFEGSNDSRYLIAEYSLSVAYDLKTGMAICSYKEGRVYRGEVNNSDNLIGFVNDGKIYSKNGAGFFEGSFDSSEIIGYIANGVVYDKYGAGFFAGSFDSNHIVGYYEGDELGAAAAAIVLLLS